MKLDNEMDRLTLEHGTMLGPPTEEERAEESTKKKLTNKVGRWGNSSASINAAWGCSLVRVSFVPPADRPFGFQSTTGPKSRIFTELWAFLRAHGALMVLSKSALKTLSPTEFTALVFKFLAVFSDVQWIHAGFLQLKNFPISRLAFHDR